MKTIKCPECFGTKQEVRMRSPYPIRKIEYRPCPRCSGTGEIPESPPKEGATRESPQLQITPAAQGLRHLHRSKDSSLVLTDQRFERLKRRITRIALALQRVGDLVKLQ